MQAHIIAFSAVVFSSAMFGRVARAHASEAEVRSSRPGAQREGVRSYIPLQAAISSGYALPFGRAFGRAFSDTASGAIPLRLDAGLRLSENVYVGIYGTLALGDIGRGHEPCD